MKEKRKRVLHMLCTDRFSGAENVVCQIVNMFSNVDEYEMIYCSPDGPIRNALEERGVTFFSITSATLLEFRRVIRQLAPDIVHAHDMKASFLAALVCGRIPLISHVHMNNFGSNGVNLKVLLYRYAAYKANHIVWVSESSYRGYRYHKELNEKSTILYNIIDSVKLYEKVNAAGSHEQYDVVYLGRLNYQKNPQRLIDVIERVAQEVPNIRVALIGSGVLEEEVKKVVAQKGLADNIHMKGFMNNPYAILEKAKVMLMTSRREGTPMCALEALALGVPIVSTPTDGLCELVVDGFNGYLSDDNYELGRRIIELLSDNSQQLIMSQNARAKAKEILSIHDYRDKLISLYENAICE